jgi:hypothetical protein
MATFITIGYGDRRVTSGPTPLCAMQPSRTMHDCAPTAP